MADYKRVKLLRKRRWLNRLSDGGNAFISTMAEAEIPTDPDAKHGGWVDCEITIADCSRQITLDFSLWRSDATAAAHANNLEKFDKLIADIEQARDAYIEGHKLLKESP